MFFSVQGFMSDNRIRRDPLSPPMSPGLLLCNTVREEQKGEGSERTRGISYLNFKEI